MKRLSGVVLVAVAAVVLCYPDSGPRPVRVATAGLADPRARGWAPVVLVLPEPAAVVVADQPPDLPTTTSTSATPTTAPPDTVPPTTAAPPAAPGPEPDTPDEPEPGAQPDPEPEPPHSDPEPEAPAVYSTGACGGGYLPTCAIMLCESGGNLTAYNASSGASGKWQIIESTWAGHGGYAEARDAPEAVQDERAAEIWAGGAGRSQWEC